MGILSNLFKTKSAKSGSERPEGRPSFAVSAFSNRNQDAEAPPVEADDATQPPEEAGEAPQKHISLGGYKRHVAERPEPTGQESRKNIAPAPTPVSEIPSRARSLVPVKTAGISDKAITIELGDLLSQIPGELLKADGGKGTKKSLLFNTFELLQGLSQGKATAPVTRIAELAPELFNGQPLPADALVELPLQKIVAQIGVFPGRPDQVEEVYPPLDARYANLVLEKGSVTPAAPPVTVLEPAISDAAPSAVETPATTAMPAVEQAVNGSAESHVVSPPDVETVSYSLAAIFPNVPESWLDGKLKSVDHTARITVPFDLIEAQLASGRVELPFADFFQSLPENLKCHFSGDRKADGPAKVLIPLNEVFTNLPGVEPLPPPAGPAPREPEDKLETAEVLEVLEAESKVAQEPAAGTVAAAPEAQKAQPLAAEIRHAIVEEQTVEALLAPVIPKPAQEPAAEPPEPAPSEAAQVEALVSKVEPAPAAAEVEPEPTVTPVPETAPEPPPVKIAPPPVTADVETSQPAAQAAAQFITPSIQIRRMAPPTLLAKEVFDPAPEMSEDVPAEPMAPTPDGPVEPVAPLEPVPALSPAVKDLIVTDGKLDTRKTVEHLILLPGITAATLTIKGKTKTAGEVPANFHPQEAGKALFQSLESHTPKGQAPVPRAITLHQDQFSSTFFKQNGVLLCVLHPRHSLEAEPHHAVLLVMEEIVRLRQH